MDPISLLVVALAVYGILQRAPGLIGEALAAAAAASRGEESQAVKDRRQRLIEAGIDPAAGGAARQFAGNWWRDFWLAMDRKRQAASAEPGGVAGAWRRWCGEAYRRAGQRVDRWRPSPGGNTEDAPEPPGRSEPGATPTVEPEAPPPPASGAGRPHPTTEPPAPRAAGPDPAAPPFPSPPTAPRHPPYPPDRPSGPVRVESTLGEPAGTPRQTAVIEGDPMANGLAPRASGGAVAAVTGVVSGAAEARAISTALAYATAAYLNDLRRIRARIHNVGDQAMTIIQFDGRSTVVNAIAEAAGAAAAAEAFATGVQNEVDPLLHNVAREFDRRNS